MFNRDVRTYPAKLERVTDGDTVRVLLDHGCYIRSTQAIRLLDVQAPEPYEVGGPEATAAVVAWFTEHSHENEWPVNVTLVKDRRTFNRYLGDIRCHTCDADLSDLSDVDGLTLYFSVE